MDTDQKSNEPVKNDSPFVVGLGSSAGGIEALINLVSALPDDLNASIVVAQHLSPTHKSQMTDILSRETDYNVEEISNNIRVRKSTIYVGPPGYHIVYKEGKLLLDKHPEEVAPKPSVNILFESMADELGDHAIGVVLSGTGNDGSRGLKAIKSVGGFALVQDPGSCKYDGMPRSALETVEVDRILDAEDVGQEVANITQNIARSLFPPSDEARNELMQALYSKIREATKIDFSFYKQSTLLRRVNRRLIATQKTSLSDYLSHLENNQDEVLALSKELLISVTDFFRDSHAFKAIKLYVSEIVEKKNTGESVRLWVAGCATGEEAYSLALLFLEEIENQQKDLSLQVFATDIDDQALAVARKGAYSPHAVNSLDSRYIEKYFQFVNDAYVPKKRLRDVITFSRQDITRDPPFLHLDMVSFRNVLIYFNSDLQQRVLSLFRYSLLNDGILFLGKSESIGLKEDLFVAMDRRSRIFKVSENSKRPAIPKMLKNNISAPRSKDVVSNSYERIFTRAVLDQYGPALLINKSFTILHSHGTLHPFINFPSGVPDFNLSKLITPEFSAELISSMNKAKRSAQITKGRVRRLESDKSKRWVLIIVPIEEKDPEHFLINFRPATDDRPVEEKEVTTKETEEADVAELIAAREQLQTLTEEMAASAEEMQALNEEVQAANEELQANNEELEATNEELQATNEELISVNEESMRKSSELAAINSELESVYNTLDFPILVFDTDRRLNRTNEAANRRYHLNTGSFGQAMHELNLPEYFEDIEQRITGTLRTGNKANIIIKPSVKETYNIFVTPIFNNRERITGAILVIIDNSELVLAHERIEKSQEQLLSIMNNSLALIALKDNAGRYEFVNTRFEERFGVNAQDVIGRTDAQVFDKHIASLFRERDLDTMRSLAPLETVDELEIDSGKVTLESVRFPIFDAEGTIKSICTQATDVTKSRHANEQLRLAGKLFDKASDAILVTDSDCNILTGNDAFTELTGYEVSELIGKPPSSLKSDDHSKAFFDEMNDNLQASGFWQGEVINLCKNGEKKRLWLTMSAVRHGDDKPVNYIATYSDVDEIKSVQRKIEFLATHDELTRLPNRTALLERLELMVSNARRADTLCAVLFIDLDNFKDINDTFGHTIGDQLLKQVARRIRDNLRDVDLLARLGGDEFVALVSATAIAEIDDVASRISSAVSTAFEVNEHALQVSASIGISVYPQDGDDSQTLLKHADDAMYTAKDAGKSQYQYFTDDMREQARAKHATQQMLKKALDNDSFELEFEAKVDIPSNAIVGAVAHLKYDGACIRGEEVRRLLDAAERSDVIASLDLHTVELVIRAMLDWQKQGVALPLITVVVSDRQWHKTDFASSVANLIDAHKVPAEKLVFEISETCLAEVDETVQQEVMQLHKMGVGVSVSEFGGASFALQNMIHSGITEIKLPAQLVQKLTQQSSDEARFITAIISFAKAMALKVVAPGVTSEEQLDALKQMGCELAEGTYFADGMDRVQVAEKLKRQG
nr:chemotaxis protein CheB [Alteromonas halophila]